MRGLKKQLPYLASEDLKKDKEVKEVLEVFLSDAAEFGIELVDKYSPREERAKLKILDCGTASGLFTKMLFERGFREICGVDLADYLAPDIKAARIIKDFRVSDFSYDALLWPNSFFDVITAWEVIEHLENPHNFVREAKRILKPGGLFFLSLPNIFSLRSRKLFFFQGEIDRYTATNNHISLFTRSLFSKTILRYFELLATDWRIDPKVYKSRLSWLKKRAPKEWFAADVFYVLKNKSNGRGKEL